MLFDSNPLQETMIQKYIGMWGANGETTECYNDVRRLQAEGKDLKAFYGLQNEKKFLYVLLMAAMKLVQIPIYNLLMETVNTYFTENVWWAGGTR